MLCGEYQHNMDQKGRVTIPSKFREDLGDKFFVCKGLDDCLFVFSAEQWKKVIDSIAEMPVAQARKLQRYFFAGATEAEPDKQGRVLLPLSLRDHAHITKEVTVIGTGTRAEIWDTASWIAYNDGQTESDIEDALGGLVI